MANENTIYLKITTPEGLLFGGNVKSITSVNDKGKFDVLKNHTNFICTIKDIVDVVDDAGKPKSFTVNKGVLRVKENIVDIYIGISGKGS